MEERPPEERRSFSKSIWRGSDSASTPPALPPSRTSCEGSLGIRITFSDVGAVPGAAVVCLGGVGSPERPATELGCEDAGVRGAVAGDGFAPLPLPGALAFGRLKRLKGKLIRSSGVNKVKDGMSLEAYLVLETKPMSNRLG